jgi:DNA polymerase elongation subunit (family B)
MAPPVYGFDIETDTATGGLDPRISAVLAVAVATEHEERVFAGPEAHVLAVVDDHLRRLPPGVLVTWNGANFDLPFVADRAGRAGVPLGLNLVPDPTIPLRRAPLAGHASAYRAKWHGHVHLDAYQVYRAAAQTLGVSGSLKNIARMVGFNPVEVDRSRVHALPTRELCLYCASDARLARILALRRWEQVCVHADVPLPRAG